MMTKITTVIFLTLLLSSNLFAKQVSITKAKKIAKNLYYERAIQNTNIKYNSIKFKNYYTISNKENPIYYVFNISDNKGFVIISADDNAYPILAYSFKNNYIKNDQPPAFSELMENYKKQIIFIKENDLHCTSKIKREWQHYSSSPFKPDLNRNSVEPLLTTTWDQDCYYSDSCPLDPAGACGHARVGCVATAMSQVMRYHKYPPQGIGSHGYNSSYGYLFANFSAATYNWDNMPDYITAPNADIAQLCYHCGVAVEMMYGPMGSGAYSESVGPALINYFGYSSSAQLKYKSNYSTTEWEELLRNELDELRPMYYSGSGEEGGHAFVCDGYQNGNHFHFNWGWGGLYNGYFYVSNLNPGTHSFNYYQSALVGVHSPLPPAANFTSNITTVLTGASISFTDLSEHIPTSWEWTFESGTPPTSNKKNPTNIVYNIPGNYSVSLTVTNNDGSDDTTKTNYIIVSNYALAVADFTCDDTIACTGSTITFSDLSLNNPDEWQWTFNPNTVNFVNGTNANSQNPQVQFNEPVKYSVSLTAANLNGSSTLTKTNLILSGGLQLPFKENFELASFKNYWTIENPDGGITWDGYYKLDGNGNSRKAAWMNYYEYSDIGQRDRLITPVINLSGHNSAYLNFKHAYAAYNSTRRDSLIVYISDDCGETWTRILEGGEDGNGSFATHPTTTSEFVPSSPNDWCGVGYGSNCTNIDLSQWAGNANVKIMFESYNGHGNMLYVDDVIVYDNYVSADFTADTTTISPGENIDFTDLSIGTVTSWLWNFDGGNPQTSNQQNPTNIIYDLPGIYNVSLTASNDSCSDTETKTNYITVNANGPYIVQKNYTINDNSGNGDSLVDNGESILLSLSMQNIGSEQANNVSVTLSSSDEYITITDSTENYGNIPQNEIVNITDGFAFDVSDSIPDGHIINFIVTATDGSDTWTSNLNIEAYAPALEIGNIIISDPTGNNNGNLDPGENADVIITTSNTGHNMAPNTVGTLTTTNSNITINNSINNFNTLDAGETDNAIFNVTVNNNAPIGSVVDFNYFVTSDLYSVQKTFYTNIGLIFEDWETGNFNQFDWQFAGNAPWTITNSNPYEGNFCAKSGNIGNLSNSQLLITLNVISDDSISFFRKVSSENTYDFLKFYIDNNEFDKWSGEKSWKRVAYPVTTGEHTFKWEYIKDEYVSNGSDCGWIDYIVFPPVSLPVSVNDIDKNNISLNAYPNPFNDKITIDYSIKNISDINLTIYNAMGQKIKVLTDIQNQTSGKHTVIFDASNLISGMYYCRLKTNNEIKIKKLMLIK